MQGGAWLVVGEDQHGGHDQRLVPLLVGDDGCGEGFRRQVERLSAFVTNAVELDRFGEPGRGAGVKRADERSLRPIELNTVLVANSRPARLLQQCFDISADPYPLLLVEGTLEAPAMSVRMMCSPGVDIVLT
ncbi:hypothetical protein G039_0328500 [Pseudomonas aeruginosa VRFPA01]|nr:hypothetical protein G039_0328500 [Pseudomonas aeruginosa VRFPA01]